MYMCSWLVVLLLVVVVARRIPSLSATVEALTALAAWALLRPAKNNNHRHHDEYSDDE
jgi:hypothetical protein